MRSFEIKKKTIEESTDQHEKIQFRIPLSIHETYKSINSTDFR